MEVRKRLADQYQRTNQASQAIEQYDIIANTLIKAGNRAAALTFLQTIIAMNPANVSEYESLMATDPEIITLFR